MKIRASVFAGIALGAVCAVQAQAADLGGGSYAVVNNWPARMSAAITEEVRSRSDTLGASAFQSRKSL